MKNILLISPSIQSKSQLLRGNTNYPLGLAYLHAVLTNRGYNVTTKNYNDIVESAAMKEIETILRETSPDYLLIQMFTMNRVAAYRVIAMARKINPFIIIIVGGIHASLMYEQLLRHHPIDFVVIGEGELTIVDLLSAIETPRDFSQVPGIAYRRANIFPRREFGIIRTPDRDLISHLDALPFPNHGLFITPDSTVANVLASRGCPAKCSFCCLFAISRRRFRTRSAVNVVDEIEYILNRFPQITTIQFSDDTFTLDNQRVIDICREIVHRDIKASFICSARLKPVSIKMFCSMKAAGFTDIAFGLETGSPRLLESIHKDITQQDAVKCFEDLSGINIRVSVFMMIGFPGETNQTVKESAKFLQRLAAIRRFTVAGVALVLVYPDTEVCAIMGVPDDFWLSHSDVPRYTAEHSLLKLYLMRNRMRFPDSLFRRLWRFSGSAARVSLRHAIRWLRAHTRSPQP